MAAVLAAGVAMGAGPANADAGAGALAGVVRDTEGALLKGAPIEVYDLTPAGDAVARTTTDQAGRFRVPGLEAGEYKVQIGLGGWSEWAPGRVGAEGATTYTVAGGRTTKANSVVTAAGIIRGKVVDGTGAAAAGVTVRADNFANAATFAATTGADGTYRLTVQPGDQYTVTVVNGYITQRADGGEFVAVGSGRTVRIDRVKLQAPATLEGRLVDAAGEPVAGATVSFIDETLFQLTTTTDANGAYRFEKLPEGTIRVSFTIVADEDTVITQWAYGAASYDEATEFALTAGAVTTVSDRLK